MVRRNLRIVRGRVVGLDLAARTVSLAVTHQGPTTQQQQQQQRQQQQQQSGTEEAEELLPYDTLCICAGARPKVSEKCGMRWIRCIVNSAHTHRMPPGCIVSTDATACQRVPPVPWRPWRTCTAAMRTLIHARRVAQVLAHHDRVVTLRDTESMQVRLGQCCACTPPHTAQPSKRCCQPAVSRLKSLHT
jgi:hypothetical protein